MFRFLALIILLTGSSPAQSDDLVTLDDLVAYALSNNADLASLEQRVEAARHRIPQAGSLMDPKLTIGLMNLPLNSFSFTQEPMTGKQLALMQNLPSPGKLDLREEIAGKDVRIAESMLAESRNDIIKSVKIIYAEWYYLEHAITTTNDNIRILRDLLKIVETKYAVGKGLQQDVLKANVELTRLQEKRISLEQMAKAKKARINALLNRAPEAPLPMPVLPSVLDAKISVDQASAWADSSRPVLKTLQQYSEQSDLRAGLAQKDKIPDFDVGVSYSQRQKLAMTGKDLADFISFTVSINLPVYASTKQNERITEHRSMARAFRSQQQQIKSQIDGAIVDVISALEKNKELVNLYRTGLIPQATESLNSNLAGYQVDKIDFLTLIQSQITLLNIQLEEHRLISDYFSKMAELEMVTGHRMN